MRTFAEDLRRTRAIERLTATALASSRALDGVSEIERGCWGQWVAEVGGHIVDYDLSVRCLRARVRADAAIRYVPVPEGVVLL